METNTRVALEKILKKLKNGETLSRSDFLFMRRNPDLFNLRWTKRVDK